MRDRRSHPPRTRSFGRTVVAIVVPVLILGAVAFATLTQSNDRSRILEAGATTVAVPTGKAVVDSQRDGTRSESVRRLEFRYEVDGTTYTAPGDQQYDRDFFDLSKALAANPTAEVRYLEDDPSQAIVLDKDYR
jgi:hypothetical protein